MQRSLLFPSLVLLSLGTLLSPTPAHAATPTVLVAGSARVAVADRYGCPAPGENRLAAPVRAEADAVRAAAEAAPGPLRRIRQCEKYAEETTGTEKVQWEKSLEEARASTNASYRAYLAAEKRLDEALAGRLESMSRHDRVMEPLMTSFVRVVPYLDARGNVMPYGSGALDAYRSTYVSKRSGSAAIPEVRFGDLAAGVDPDFAGLCRLLSDFEGRHGFPAGFLHAIAWRESVGDPQMGACNADERGLFQVQAVDYRPEFGIDIDEPAASNWGRFEDLSNWVPFNAALAMHAYRRHLHMAELLGFDGEDRFHLAYRFFNESPSYVFFCQERLRRYRDVMGVDADDLSCTDLPVLDRFIHFREKEILQQYDWPLTEGVSAGEALWAAWRDAVIEIESDFIWTFLVERLEIVDFPQDYVLEELPDGRRICRVDLTEQSVKRRGTIGIDGRTLTAIGICTARGVLPTARLMREYFNLPADERGISPTPKEEPEP